MSVMLAAFIGTLVLTTLEASAQQLRLSRMSIPYLLGTMFTRDRDRARLYGFLAHLVNGQIFGLIYMAVFHALGRSGFTIGALVGLAHALVVLLVIVPIFPAIHPRMASVHEGPTETRQIEPPGALALHYGFTTPATVLVAHVIFGALVGLLYRM